jgi:hypothetical protein
MRNNPIFRVIAVALTLLGLWPSTGFAQQANSLGGFDKNNWAQFINNSNCLTIVSASSANPTVLTTNLPHNMNPAWAGAQGNTITIAGATGFTGINGSWAPTWISPTTFSIPINGVSNTYNANTGYFPNGLSTSVGQPTPTAWDPTSCPFYTPWDLSSNLPYIADPCQTHAKTNVPISQTSSGTVITGTASKKNYVCSLALISSAGVNVSLVEYSGACAGGTPVALLGSTTAANGLSLGVNGGLTLGNGAATVVGGSTAGYNVCLLQNGAGTVAGNLTYVQM